VVEIVEEFVEFQALLILLYRDRFGTVFVIGGKK